MLARPEIDPRDPRPLWLQIEDSLVRLIASGALAPAARLPSVRDLAADLRVNPATVARAYRQLTRSGVAEVRRGEGTFVSPTPPEPAAGAADELLDAARRFAARARALGAPRDAAAAALERAWRELSHERERKAR